MGISSSFQQRFVVYYLSLSLSLSLSSGYDMLYKLFACVKIVPDMSDRCKLTESREHVTMVQFSLIPVAH